MAKGNKTTIEFTCDGNSYEITYDSYSEAMKSIRAWRKARKDRSKNGYRVVS